MTVLEAQNSILIQPQGALNASSGGQLVEKVASVVPGQQQLCILDLARVDAIDSGGLVALIKSHKLADQSQCRLVLCNLSPSVRLIFEITQLDQAFEIFDTHGEMAQVLALKLDTKAKAGGTAA